MPKGAENVDNVVAVIAFAAQEVFAMFGKFDLCAGTVSAGAVAANRADVADTCFGEKTGIGKLFDRNFFEFSFSGVQIEILHKFFSFKSPRRFFRLRRDSGRRQAGFCLRIKLILSA